MKKIKDDSFNQSQNLELTPLQVALFEICMLSGGALFTLYIPSFILYIERFLWILLIIPGIYICYIHFKQANK
ncbi:MAG: hypothetical protein WAZ12_03355 [Candidatus Absconditicoccaceae bacterium]